MAVENEQWELTEGSEKNERKISSATSYFNVCFISIRSTLVAIIGVALLYYILRFRKQELSTRAGRLPRLTYWQDAVMQNNIHAITDSMWTYMGKSCEALYSGESMILEKPHIYDSNSKHVEPIVVKPFTEMIIGSEKLGTVYDVLQTNCLTPISSYVTIQQNQKDLLKRAILEKYILFPFPEELNNNFLVPLQPTSCKIADHEEVYRKEYSHLINLVTCMDQSWNQETWENYLNNYSTSTINHILQTCLQSSNHAVLIASAILNDKRLRTCISPQCFTNIQQVGNGKDENIEDTSKESVCSLCCETIQPDNVAHCENEKCNFYCRGCIKQLMRMTAKTDQFECPFCKLKQNA